MGTLKIPPHEFEMVSERVRTWRYWRAGETYWRHRSIRPPLSGSW